MAKKSALPTSKAKTAYGLLSEIRKLILTEPLRYDQGDWLRRGNEAVWIHERVPSCGTVGCVAGWVCALKAPDTLYRDVSDAADAILGLDSFQGNELFDGDAAKGPPQTRAHARSGAAHIARFQKKHARQLKAKAV